MGASQAKQIVKPKAPKTKSIFNKPKKPSYSEDDDRIIWIRRRKRKEDPKISKVENTEKDRDQKKKESSSSGLFCCGGKQALRTIEKDRKPATECCFPCLTYENETPTTRLIIAFGDSNKDAGMNLKQIEPLAIAMRAHLIVFEYPTFGLNKAESSSEKQVYSDSQDLLYYIKKMIKFEENQIFIYGCQVGCAVTTHICRKVQFTGVFLVDPSLSSKDILVKEGSKVDENTEELFYLSKKLSQLETAVVFVMTEDKNSKKAEQKGQEGKEEEEKLKNQQKGNQKVKGNEEEDQAINLYRMCPSEHKLPLDFPDKHYDDLKLDKEVAEPSLQFFESHGIIPSESNFFSNLFAYGTEKKSIDMKKLNRVKYQKDVNSLKSHKSRSGVRSNLDFNNINGPNSNQGRDLETIESGLKE